MKDCRLRRAIIRWAASRACSLIRLEPCGDLANVDKISLIRYDGGKILEIISSSNHLPYPATSVSDTTCYTVVTMAAIGSLVFCTDCGDLLEGTSGDKKAILICAVCGTENKGSNS